MDVPGPGPLVDAVPGGGRRAALLAIGDPAAALQIAETLLASAEGWRVARLGLERLTRLDLKRAIDDVVAAKPSTIFIAIAAPLAEVGGAPALILGDDPGRYADELTLPLAWLGERLGAAASSTVVIVATPRLPAATVVDASLAALAAADPLVVIAAPGDDALSAVAAALAGAALDPTTGTVTFASLGRYLTAALGERAIRGSSRDASVVAPPPVAPSLELLRSRRAGDGRTAAGVGTVLPGRFRLDAELARGSFGVVYRARQLAVDRDVAIKLLHADLDPASADGRLFLHEIRAVGRLDHPHVVRIYQADVSHDGRLFFAMELLRGRTLAEIVADGPVQLERAVRLGGQLLAGLAAAHDAGLVHADIKPANAMVVASRAEERLVLVDFGLARLRVSEPAVAAGGTPAFMAPEQLRDGRVDARSDVFAVGLVLVALLTGWRRRNARELVPPLDAITDVRVREILARALALEPRDRFASAAEFAAALTAGPAVAPSPSRPPFVRLASLTEADHDRLCGRDRDREVLIDHALFRPAVVVTAPSGVGKTSLLRAGLVPRLGALGVTAIYASGRAAPLPAIVQALAPGAPDLATALAARASEGRVVIVLDQLEAMLDHDDDALAEILALVAAPVPEVAVVLSVREDFLARLLAQPALVAAPAPVVRIGPIDRASAEQALAAPLAEHRIALEPALATAILDDLVTAAASMAPELGWGDAPAVFPPHLQLVGAALYDVLPADAHRLTREHYQALGGFAAVVGEHLERVLETELTAPQAAIAREVFLALVTTASERATRTEAELFAVTGAAAAVTAVLEVLRTQGLVVPVRDAEPRWELAHDSLVPRVQAWIDRRDLARRRAMEQVRYHLRRGRGGAASYLTRAELRELDSHPGALAELDAEHARRGGDELGPTALVARSRRGARRRAVAVVGLAVAVAGGVGAAGYDRWSIAAEAARERSRAERDLGRFTLELAPFDWDPPLAVPAAPGGRARPVAAAELPEVHLAFHDPDPSDPDAPGAPRPAARASIRPVPGHPGRYLVQASGGGAYLSIDGRHRAGEAPCGPSIIPVRALPGYATSRGAPPTFTIAVPTCQATLAGTIEIPAGPFIEGGPGEPPSALQVKYEQVERVTDLPAFRIDQTEVTNAAYAQLASMSALTLIAPPIYPDTDELEAAAGREYPVTSLSWQHARVYCRFFGKRLPTRLEWQKALRGGRELPGGIPNPYPRRNYPWGDPTRPITANIVFEEPVSPMPVGSVPGDVSPYGVVDLAGNIQEWTNDHDDRGLAIASGGEWAATPVAVLSDMLAVAHDRPEGMVTYFLGVRCAL